MVLLKILKALDLKTWLIVILGVMMAAMVMLNRPGPNPLKSALSDLKKEHRKEMKDIEKQNKQLEQRIEDYADIIDENDRKIAKRDEALAKLESDYDLTRKERDRLKKELVEFEAEFKEMSDEEFIQWLRDFFKEKGIRE